MTSVSSQVPENVQQIPFVPDIIERFRCVWEGVPILSKDINSIIKKYVNFVENW